MSSIQGTLRTTALSPRKFPKKIAIKNASLNESSKNHCQYAALNPTKMAWKRSGRNSIMLTHPRIKRTFPVTNLDASQRRNITSPLMRHMSGSASSGDAKGRGPVSWTMLGVVGVAAAAAVGYYRVERERRLEDALGKIVSTGKPAIGGPWSLVDLQGQLVTEKSFRGKWTLLYFGFARCPDICPSEMSKVANVIDMLKQKHPELAAEILPIFVSVDPARDSLKALTEYAKDFHPDYVFLTGAPEQVQQMAKKYRVYVSKADETEDGDYLVDHSIVLYFHDDNGELADVFTQSMKPTDVMEKVIRSMTFVPSF